jgi:hypothetical protein
MKVSFYNPANGALVAEAATGFTFGAVRRGSHCDSPILIRPAKTVENNILEMKMFLQANGGLDHSHFGHFTSDGFVTGVDYTNILSDHFTLATGVTGWPVSGASGVSGLDIVCASGQPQGYVWLDLEVGENEVAVGRKSMNYRFCYDYN